MDDYKYQYCIVVKTAKRMDDFNQYKEVILECRDVYNEKSANSRNPKKIGKITFHKENLEIELSSESQLNTPLIALRQFSTALVKKKVMEKYMRDSRLFVCLRVKNISNTESYSNQEVVKKVIEIFDDEYSEQEIQQINKEFRQEIRYTIEQYKLRKADKEN